MSSEPPPTESHRGLVVVAICFLTIVFDGYDLIVYGSVVPALLAEPGWGLGPAQIGAIGSYALAGMLVGALGAGAITDRVGRRKIMLVGIAWFSRPGRGAAERDRAHRGVRPARAPAVLQRADVRRLLGGRGARGGPRAGAGGRPGLAGDVLDRRGAAGAGAARRDRVPARVGRLPRGPRAHRGGRGAHGSLRRHARRPGTRTGRGSAGAVRRPVPRRDAAVRRDELLRAAPRLRVEHLAAEDHDRGRVRARLCAAVPAGARPRGHRRRDRGLGAFLAATACLLLLSQRLDMALLFGAVAVAGLGRVGTQILVNGYVAVHYPAATRATALGWALGVGRAGAIIGPLFGGWVLASGFGFEWNFYGFAVPALAGALLIALVPRARATLDPARTAHEEATA